MTERDGVLHLNDIELEDDVFQRNQTLQVNDQDQANIAPGKFNSNKKLVGLDK